MDNIYIDEKALENHMKHSPEVLAQMEAKAKAIADKANSLSSSFRTQVVRDWHTGETVGGTRPNYTYSAKHGYKQNVALAATNNYAARKDNMLNNTLLKAKG